ncbi:hypothetical protein D3Z50_15800 [Clostridiaceae bacterium]|nr:hypothetical protein [Clostridiaceae bacterium]
MWINFGERRRDSGEYAGNVYKWGWGCPHGKILINQQVSDYNVNNLGVVQVKINHLSTSYPHFVDK